MKQKLVIVTGAVLAVLLVYEIAYRVCTRQWGEIDTDATPVSLYYSCDLMAGCNTMENVFAPRTALPLGKVRLARGTGAYVSGGRFYRRTPEGSWHDLTELFQKRNREKRIEHHAGG
ncbi:MAG: hypothetical protein HQ523_16375 [Lentisphaerae bacterium]|nr:hypothetical protein [Lentisphaerota bacterium]